MTEKTEQQRINSAKWPCFDVDPDIHRIYDAVTRGQTLEEAGIPNDAEHRRCYEKLVANMAEYRRNWRPGTWLDTPVE